MQVVRPLLIGLLLISCVFSASLGQSRQKRVVTVEVLILGGGASGTAAGIQTARMGTKTLIVEPTAWIGGMLTAAGVSAIDGNHQLPSGIWAEFREQLYSHYGGPKAVETGWVSNTLFEPKVGFEKLKSLAELPQLEIWYQATWSTLKHENGRFEVSVRYGKRELTVSASVLIDATELGDAMAAMGVSYDVGMDSRAVSGERFAPENANDIVQDLTYALTLKDYGPAADKTIARPEGYDPEVFRCACSPGGKNGLSCEQMLNYGKLPNGKYMINWPICGNDVYLNLIHDDAATREQKLQEAKLESLRFLYFIQHELGFKHLGLADDEFPTKDLLPLMPYHRESRRLKGLVRLNVNHLAEPFSQAQPLYRTGIAVGDYPIDHHHEKNPEAPKIDFINIKVPAYNVPLGALLPAEQTGLIVAEKSISVTNIVNGATRLQPVVLGIGQAAGALAALAVKNGTPPQQVPVRQVQQALLEAGAYLMPYFDVKPDMPAFQAIQRIGATGILRGSGVPFKWANQTWFYPELPISEYDFTQNLRSYYPEPLKEIHPSGNLLTLGFLTQLLQAIEPKLTSGEVAKVWKTLALAGEPQAEQQLNRAQIAQLLDSLLNPFALPIDHHGNLIRHGD
jgi:hypothetical protein